MSSIRSIVRNLRLILRQDLGSDLEALRNRLETRTDRYEQAVDERIDALTVRMNETLVASQERLESGLVEIRSSLDGRLSGYEQVVDQRIDDRLATIELANDRRFAESEELVRSKFVEIETAFVRRADSYEQAVDQRIDGRLAAVERALDLRTDSYEQALDRRIEERLQAVETAIGHRFGEHSRALDIRLDDRQVGMDRRIDDHIREMEKRTDARHEAHELRIDRTLVQNREDIIERTDLLLQVFDQRLDRWRQLSPGQPAQTAPMSLSGPTGEGLSRQSPISQRILDWGEHSTTGLGSYSADEQEIVDYVLSFIDDPAGRDYVKQHMRRYLSTLHRIPPARRSGDKVLELGSLTPLAPAIRRYCGYQSIVGNNFWPGEEKIAEKVFAQASGSERFAIPLHNFNVEADRFPFPDGAFRVVLCGELLEHLQHDPLHMLWECNRILEDDGQLILTTPNIAGCRSIEGVLTGCSPYLFSQYNLTSSFDQHHREYAPREVRTALTAAGFEVLKLETEDVWRRSNPAILQLLESLELPTELRGDNIFAIARKAGQPVERYPRELYID